MKKLFCFVAVALALCFCGALAESRAAQTDCANDTDQIVLVEYTGGTGCIVSFHEKTGGEWVEILSTNGYVGKNGMGKQKAGDKRTPLGTYNLNTPFGILEDPGTILEYTQVTKYHYWCGNSNSGYYNQFCDSRINGRPVQSGDEHLITYKGVYNYCLFIDYNAAGVPGKGSCIFLHCTGNKSYTAGCVAIPEDDMRTVICRVREGAKIVLVDRVLGESEEAEDEEVPDEETADAPEADSGSAGTVDPDQPNEVAGETVRISGGDCFVRAEPDKDAGKIGVLKEGSAAPFAGSIATDNRGVDWYLVAYEDTEGWVSSKFAHFE